MTLDTSAGQSSEDHIPHMTLDIPGYLPVKIIYRDEFLMESDSPQNIPAGKAKLVTTLADTVIEFDVELDGFDSSVFCGYQRIKRGK